MEEVILGRVYRSITLGRMGETRGAESVSRRKTITKILVAALYGSTAFILVGVLLPFSWDILRPVLVPSLVTVSPLSIQKSPLERSALRILSFGTSIDPGNHGSGVPQEQRLDTYSVLLGADTVATSDLVLSAACTQTILQNRMYDAITIEFHSFDQTTEKLIHRLRARFPNAFIVLIHTWTPRKLVNERGQSLLDLSKLEQTPIQSREFLHQIVSMEDSWALPDQHKYLLETAKERYNINLVYQLPFPTEQDFNSVDTLQRLLSAFDEDGYISIQGHSLIAKSIETSIQRSYHEETIELGTWGEGDKCGADFSLVSKKQSYIRTGLATVFGGRSHIIRHHTIRDGDSIEVENPFSEDRVLYITYMTSSDELFEHVYPKTKVTIVETSSSIVIDPYHENPDFQEISRTTGVGMISPGKSTIQFLPLHSSRKSFQLLGISFLAKVGTGVSLENLSIS